MVHLVSPQAGRDLGEALRSHTGGRLARWRKRSSKFLLTESHSDGALTVGDFNLSVERLMAARSGSFATFPTSYSVRRAQPFMP